MVGDRPFPVKVWKEALCFVFPNPVALVVNNKYDLHLDDVLHRDIICQTHIWQEPFRCIRHLGL